jgi:hypothetical protein
MATFDPTRFSHIPAGGYRGKNKPAPVVDHPRPDWMNDPSLLPKKPPKAAK